LAKKEFPEILQRTCSPYCEDQLAWAERIINETQEWFVWWFGDKE